MLFVLARFHAGCSKGKKILQGEEEDVGSHWVLLPTASLLGDGQKTNPSRVGKAELHLHASHATGNGRAFI